MAKELEIVEQINTDLQEGQFSSKRFQKGRFSAIAELIIKKDDEQNQTMPAIVDNDGSTTKLVIDDIYPFEVYHRHTGSGVSPVDEQFGDRVLREETANMIMVIMGDRGRLKMTKEQLTTGIMLGMPLELGQAFLTANSLDYVNIIPGTFNFDRVDAWNGEFNTTEVSLKPNTIFFTMEYDIVTRANVECIDICD